MDIQGINGHESIKAPVRIKFKDKDGKWIEGISEPQIDPNHFRVWLNIIARDRHGKITGIREGPANLLTNQFAAFVQYFILGNTSLNTNPKRLSDGAATALSGANTTITMRAGTGTTAASVQNTALETQTEGPTSATVNANPTTGTTQGSFTVTCTITAGADRAYTEVGMSVTNNTNVFLISHDIFSVLNVSNGGTLAITYTLNNS